MTKYVCFKCKTNALGTRRKPPKGWRTVWSGMYGRNYCEDCKPKGP